MPILRRQYRALGAPHPAAKSLSSHTPLRYRKANEPSAPTKDARPGIQSNSKGIPFFCEFGTNKLVKIDPHTLQITEYPLAEGARPRRLTIADDDQVYFTDYEGGNLGRLDPVSGAVKVCPPGGRGSNPYGITITPDGMVWYRECGVTPNTVARFNPKTQGICPRKYTLRRRHRAQHGRHPRRPHLPSLQRRQQSSRSRATPLITAHS